jgi:sporulation protein YlmC with PRC-barrel domain
MPPANYTMPATGWIPPAAYGYPLGAFLWPVSGEYAEQSVMARTAGEGEGEIWPAIGKDSVVRDRAGEHIGVVDDVRFDTSDGLRQGFVVRAGGSIQTFFGGGGTLEVASSQMHRVDEGVVYLRADKQDMCAVRADPRASRPRSQRFRVGRRGGWAWGTRPT